VVKNIGPLLRQHPGLVFEAAVSFLHQGSIFLQGFQRIQDVWEGIILHLYGLKGRLCLFLRFGDNHGHRIAHVPHTVYGHGLLILTGIPVIERAALAGHHFPDPRHGLCRRRVDGKNHGMGMQRAQGLRIEHTRQLDIGDKKRPARHFLVTVAAVIGFSHAFHGHAALPPRVIPDIYPIISQSGRGGK